MRAEADAIREVGAQDAFVSACRRGDLEQAKTDLDEDGVHVDRENHVGETALVEACARGHLVAVQWLVEDAHADMNATNYVRESPFLTACFHGQLATAKWLAVRGANLRATATTNDITPFWAACCNGKVRVARWLAITVGIGDDVTRAPHSGNNKGVTPLAIAEAWGYSAVTSWLASFLQRRVLIAHWSVGRDRYRANLPRLGNSPEAAVWSRLPREAMANVLLLLLASP